MVFKQTSEKLESCDHLWECIRWGDQELWSPSGRSLQGVSGATAELSEGEQKEKHSQSGVDLVS